VSGAEAWYRLKQVTPWPERRPKPIKTAILAGRVVEDSTGCALPFCQVVVEETRCSAYTDMNGAFVLADVPIGEAGVDACMGSSRRHVTVCVPQTCSSSRFHVIRCEGSQDVVEESRRAIAVSRCEKRALGLRQAEARIHGMVASSTP
jgi:hypothetical protein